MGEPVFEKRISWGRQRKGVFLLLFAAAILILGYALGRMEFPGDKPRKVECLGNDELSAPLFTLPDLGGRKVELISFKGKVILLEFWATWCAPCREAIPHLNELQRKYRDQGLVVIGISLDRKAPEEVGRFLEKYGVDYLNLMGTDEVFETYSQIPGLGPIRGIPATFIIDRQGRICKRFLGLTPKKTLEELLRSVL